MTNLLEHLLGTSFPMGFFVVGLVIVGVVIMSMYAMLWAWRELRFRVWEYFYKKKHGGE